ncbi:ras guanyl-nucleotide exchange factor [Diplodia corticola]|uniref:Ras guanyl-nucleotide exchange factor n=1 Tax=Diplodia corticola TaxID=236234 RepID=A0A1J9RJ85_9PEZI|nr:ras guanyl-nucleotide exchange factor [Diplodia corticola]OJD40521.1 ras guanyl-nucleotide exchange factor [Diplodia corticola]
MSATTPAAPQLRSFYRRLLRELPARAPKVAPSTRSSQPILSNPSPLQHHIRTQLAAPSAASARAPSLEETEQFVQYVKAQRMYITLLERYNPGMNMDEEERVRLTARRVGMDLPVEADVPGKKN